MSAKPLVQRQAAQRDIAEAIAHYRSEAGDRVALGLIDALEGTFGQISQNPQLGSNRYGYALQIEGLKSWPLKRFPYLAFYMEHPAQIEIWRVLHGQSDIPAWLAEPDQRPTDPPTPPPPASSGQA